MHDLQKALLAMAAGIGVAAGAGSASAAGSPPPPPPPPPPCGCHGHHHHHGPPPDFHLNVQAQAQAQAQAQGAGGGGGWSVEEGSPSLIGALNVETGEARTEVRKVAYQATRRITERVIIQAVCIDDRVVPHPASQVHAEREVEDSYAGEVFRCIAGTRLQVTFSKYEGQENFEGGKTIDCHKNEALYHAPGGEVACREQIPERDCNERSLLRRYGAGVKILTMVREETYTAYRDETVTTESKSQSSSAMVLDGGVGGVVR